MSRMRSMRSNTVTISDLAKRDPEIARLFPEAVAKPAPEIEPFDAHAQLSTMQQAALLSLTESVPARRCIMKLMEDSQDRYSGQDFASLREMMLAEFKPGYRLHQITALGRIAASDLTKKLCQKYQIHILTGGNGNLRGSNHYSCCCGMWSTYVERNIHSGNQATWKFLKHCDDARRLAAKELAANALRKMPGSA